MTEIIFKMQVKNKSYINKIILDALKSFNIEVKIKTVIIKKDNRLCDDIEVDYSTLKSGKITILFGQNNKITRKSIFHEIGHVWDAVENGLDFSDDKKFSKRQQVIGGIIINLSLDGRLEKMKLPHYTRRERLKFFNYANKKFNLGLNKNDFLKIWGANLKKKDIINMIKKYK